MSASELPKTALSSFLEERMGSAIEAERIARANKLGLQPYMVPGCDGLSVRGGFGTWGLHCLYILSGISKP